MTNNPTIDGVSRELAQWALDSLDECIMENEPSKVAELRRLLDAPAVERQEPSPVSRFWCHEAQNIRCVRESDYDAAQSTIAQLQARIAELESGKGERQDGSALMKIAADLAQRHPMRKLYLVCERQGRINTDSLHEHLDECGDLLAGIALDIRKAITAPPAPVAVVLPEKSVLQDLACKRYGYQTNQLCMLNGSELDWVWQACLDATAALNGVEK